MGHGLNPLDLQSLLKIFSINPNVQKAVLFGSRAKGNYHSGSDIDIAVYGENLDFEDLLDLKASVDNLEMLQKTDLLLFNKIQNAELIDHINRVGIVMYEKTGK